MMGRRLWFSFAMVALAAVPSDTLGAQPPRALPQGAPHGLPSRAEAQTVCHMVAARGLALLPMLFKKGVLDGNNDGVPDAVTVGVGGGTLNWEELQIRPRGAAKDSAPIAITPEDDFQPGDYLPKGARWLPYGGRVYQLYFDGVDERHVSYLGYVDAKNVEHLVCDFSNVEKETLRPTAKAAGGVCRAIARGQASYVPVDEVKDTDSGINIGRERTSIAGRVTVDFANAGTPAPLALLDFQSPGGRVCEYKYFDLVADGRIASSGDAHEALMKVQAIGPDRGGLYGRCDGYARRWLNYSGLTYAEIAAPSDGAYIPPFREVKLARNGRIETRCRGDFAVSWQVKSMGPTFK